MNAKNKLGRTQIEQARSIRKSLGIKVAAKYMANRGWSIEAALWALLQVDCREE